MEQKRWLHAPCPFLYRFGTVFSTLPSYRPTIEPVGRARDLVGSGIMSLLHPQNLQKTVTAWKSPQNRSMTIRKFAMLSIWYGTIDTVR